MVRQKVSAWELRRRFNEGRYLERAEAGELIMVVETDRHPSKPKAQEPYCTRSQMVVYRDRRGRELVRCHRYLRPDQTIGASGRPDPKSLREGHTLYIAIND
jgi:hypothetical protein